MTENKSGIYNILKDYILLSLAAVTMAFSVVAFMAPHKIMDGGFTGLAIILHHLLGTPIGAVALGFMSIVMFIGYKILGPSFGIKSVYTTVLFTLSIDFLRHFLHLGKLTNDMTLSVFYGGVLSGLSMAVVFYSGGSTGGTDVLAAIMKKYFGFSLGRSLMIIDLVVVLVAGAFFGAEILMYSLILIFIGTNVIDFFLNGISASVRIWIVSDNWEEIRDMILQDYGRGVTTFEGEGGYTGIRKKIIVTYVPRRYVTKIRRELHELDPDVFFAVDPSAGVYGEGFKHPGHE
ncbi:YitT family protein [Myxococcota bacterium]|nr:YitT family protein [Myxococcota bacterium]MBU1383096.1 YitT family protein [Myxococcota bacterium]MBU1497966.1 YitT family protein [Myxococcota bacterium]